MRVSLLFTLALATISQVVADFPVHIVCASAPWPPRIQPSWDSLIHSITVAVTRPGEPTQDMTFKSGALILYGGHTSNDVWITQAGSQGGRQWYLMAGIAEDRNGRRLGNAPAPYDEMSFLARTMQASCEDPANDRAYIMSGKLHENDRKFLHDVWATDDGRVWEEVTSYEFPARAFSSCAVNHNEYVFLTAGQGEPYPTKTNEISDEFNDVWRSRTHGMSWERMTDAAPWSARYETLMFANDMPIAKNDILYVIGGKHDRDGVDRGYLNDVWVSSDDGKNWAQLTAHAPWAARWGHSGVVTRDGVIVFFGGAVQDDYYSRTDMPFSYYGDIWASFDGGYTWSECTQGRNMYNRSEAAVTMDVTGHFMMAAGYSIRQPRSHVDDPILDWNNDVVRAEFSLERDQDGLFDGGRSFAEICGATYPSNGPGLRVWPPAKHDKKAGAVAGAICISLLVLIAGLTYAWVKYSVKTYKEWRWPTPTILKNLAIGAVPQWVPLPASIRAGAVELETTSNLGESLLTDSQREGQASMSPLSASPVSAESQA